MQLILTEEDIKSFSEDFQKELSSKLATIFGFSSAVSVNHLTEEIDKDPEELPIKAIKRFMSGVSVKTREVLKNFAELDGETTVRNLESVVEDLHWPGFMSGVTRRLRSITGDDTAVFFGWEDADDETHWKDAKVSISPMTCDSLKKHFSI